MNFLLLQASCGLDSSTIRLFQEKKKKSPFKQRKLPRINEVTQGIFKYARSHSVDQMIIIDGAHTNKKTHVYQ